MKRITYEMTLAFACMAVAGGIALSAVSMPFWATLAFFAAAILYNSANLKNEIRGMHAQRTWLAGQAIDNDVCIRRLRRRCNDLERMNQVVVTALNAHAGKTLVQAKPEEDLG